MKEYKFKINGNDYVVSVNSTEDNNASVSVNGTDYSIEVSGMTTKPKTPKVVQQSTVPSTDAHPAVAKTSKPTAGTAVKSPLPGVILDIKIKEGQAVKVGQVLIVLEAMKMENNIESNQDGVVKAIQVGKGDSVLEGDILLTIE